MRDLINIVTEALDADLAEDWDHYTEFGHTRGSSIVYFMLPGGKIVEHPYTTKEDGHDVFDREGMEAKSLAVGRIDPKKMKISVRTPLAPGNCHFYIPQAKLDFIAGKLKRRYPEYEIWYFGRGATDIRQIA